MNEIDRLLESWRNDDYNNYLALKAAWEAVNLLNSKVKELEAQVEALSNR